MISLDILAHTVVNLFSLKVFDSALGAVKK